MVEGRVKTIGLQMDKLQASRWSGEASEGLQNALDAQRHDTSKLFSYETSSKSFLNLKSREWSSTPVCQNDLAKRIRPLIPMLVLPVDIRRAIRSSNHTRSKHVGKKKSDCA